MKINTKQLFLAAALQLAGGYAFSQEPVVEPPVQEPPIKPKQPEVLTVVEEQADFPGGKAAMNQFLAQNMRYPQRAVELDLQGKCYLQFIVTKTGEIKDIKVKKGVPDCPECDAEAVRVVKSMPKWNPGKNGGKAVDSYFTMPLIFKLN